VPIARDQLLNVLTWLRWEVYPGLVGHPLDDEGIAAWLCDNYVRYRQTLGHEDAKHHVFADIEAVVKGSRPQPPVTPGAPQTLQGPIGVDGRDFVAPV
jgi:hypothetical protein